MDVHFDSELRCWPIGKSVVFPLDVRQKLPLA